MVIMMRNLLGSFNGATYALMLSPSRSGTRQCKWTVVELHVPQIYSTEVSKKANYANNLNTNNLGLFLDGPLMPIRSLNSPHCHS